VKNINEFLYGVRACRTRETADGAIEVEPILHFFWRATHHGVPVEDRMPSSDFDFYLDLLASVAFAVGEEHTLKTKAAAFWNIFGSMQEIELPVFLLVNVVNSCFSSNHSELCDRLRKVVVKKAAEWSKACKGATPPKPCPSYKPLLLGSSTLDSRGHLPLTMFLKLAVEAAMAQRARDSKLLDVVFESWIGPEGRSFDAFVQMMTLACPDMDEERMVALYQQATSGEDPDKVSMALVEGELRKADIKLRRKPGRGSLGDGVGTNDDIRAASIALTLFGHHEEQHEEELHQEAPTHAYRFASKWRTAGLAAMATDLLKDLELMRTTGENAMVEPVTAAPAAAQES